ncbi:MAG: nucleoside-diphosphate sugar epimerase, partial [Candidatus Hydrothermarchaeota archaeon]
YNIAFGKRTSILELAEKIISLTSSNSKIVFEKPRKGDIRHSLASIEKAKRDLGYNPEYDLEKGLKKTIEWFREKTNSKAA